MKNRNLVHSDDWSTPSHILKELNLEFGELFDPCPLMHDLHIWDGLLIDWNDKNFINPPYSRILKERFILKAFNEAKKGKLCVMFLPVSTSTIIFHEIIYPYAEIRFIKGRLKFKNPNILEKTNCGMHDSMIVIFYPNLNKARGEP